MDDFQSYEKKINEMFYPDYFFSEVRDGFFVPEMMKKAWASCIKNYKMLEHVCESFGIENSVMWGTLLGAIRNGGFIPWDDDIDTEMKREEYIKLKEAADEGQLYGDYWLSDLYNNGDTNVVRRWMNSPTEILSPEKMSDNYGFPFNNATDIFILDRVPKDDDERSLFYNITVLVGQLNNLLGESSKGEDIYENTEFSDRLRKFEEVFDIEFDRKKDIQLQIMSEYDKFCTLFLKSDYDKIGSIAHVIEGKNVLVDRVTYDDYIDMEFEVTTVRIPIGYDELLRRYYKDYAYPVYVYTNHQYPFYRGIEENIKEVFGYELTKYRYSKSAADCNKSKRTCENLNNNSKKKIVFLVLRSAEWKSLHFLWEKMVLNEDLEVTVIPVPFYYKNYYGEVIKDELWIDTELYPENVGLTSYDEYDFTVEHPEVIIYQSPYDEYSLAMTVHPFYYSGNLYKYTEKMVFIPSFELREITEEDSRGRRSLSSYLINPGLFYADEIYVQSENMRKVFKEILEEHIAESGDEEGQFEGKVFGFGSPLRDWESRKRILIGDEKGMMFDKNGAQVTMEFYDDAFILPDEWLNMLRRSDGVFKKQIYYFLSASMLLENGMDAVMKAEKALQYMSSFSDDLLIVWELDENAEKILKGRKDEAWDGYNKLVEKYGKCGNALILEEDISYMSPVFDAMYGDCCKMLNECRKNGKPVLWENPCAKIDDVSTTINKEWKKDILVATEGDETDQWSLNEFIPAVFGFEAESPVTDNAELIADSILCEDENISDRFYKLRELNQKIRDKVKKADLKKKIVFLPYKPANWQAMESVWKSAVEDEGFDVYVMPVPWCYYNDDCSLADEWNCELDDFPSYVEVTDYRKMSVSDVRPDIIIIQNPYDCYNSTTSVHPFFYATNLKKMTDKLIYIPWFVTNEIDYNNPEDEKAVFNMRYYVTMPGVMESDIVITQSELMRNSYIEYLTNYAGEYSRKIWEKRIHGFGSPLNEKNEGDSFDMIPKSEIWSKIKAVAADEIK